MLTIRSAIKLAPFARTPIAIMIKVNSMKGVHRSPAVKAALAVGMLLVASKLHVASSQADSVTAREITLVDDKGRECLSLSAVNGAGKIRLRGGPNADRDLLCIEVDALGNPKVSLYGKDQSVEAYISLCGEPVRMQAGYMAQPHWKGTGLNWLVNSSPEVTVDLGDDVKDK